MNKSKSSHILQLSKDLLDDIELSRLQTLELLLKAARLARIAEKEEVQKWLKFETIGYNSGDKVSLKYMGLTGRWINKKEMKGYWGSLSVQESSVQSMQIQLRNMQIQNLQYSPSSANPNEYVSGFGVNRLKEVTDSIAVRGSRLGSSINKIGSIKSRVIGLIHEFVSAVYYEMLFSDLAGSIFEQYKGEVDKSISHLNEEILSKLPSVYERLASGDSEAISQGLTTCRRIIDGFADAIYPPASDAVEIEGKPLELGRSNYKNRINAYVSERTSSKSRKKRIRQLLSNIYDGVSSGVHSDVTLDEAKALLLQTYMLLGEVSSLPDLTIETSLTEAHIDVVDASEIETGQSGSDEGKKD